MNTAELKTRFDELYATMQTSKDVAKMRHFGEAFKKMFNEVAERDARLASTIIEYLSMMEFNNFVTADEAMRVAATFINADTAVTGNSEPTKGAHWNMDSVKTFLSQRGIELEDKPHYNWAALWLTMNMIYSDFGNTIADILGSKEGEKIATTCYKMAVARLRDPDRPRFIREYFHLDD